MLPLNTFPGLLYWTAVLSAVSVAQCARRPRPPPVYKCKDANGNEVPCKSSWIAYVVALSIVGTIVLGILLWYFVPRCRRKLKERKANKPYMSQRYERLEESGGVTANAPIGQHNPDAPYDPPSFPAGYTAPELSYEYKPPQAQISGTKPAPQV